MGLSIRVYRAHVLPFVFLQFSKSTLFDTSLDLSDSRDSTLRGHLFTLTDTLRLRQVRQRFGNHRDLTFFEVLL